MLNNRGWGLQALMLGIVVLMMSLVIAYSIASKIFPNSNEKYIKMEEEIVEALKKYKNKNKIVVSGDEQKVITIKTLKEANYVSDFECTGYGIYSKDTKDVYKAYINCDYYTTDGYLNYLDESL